MKQVRFDTPRRSDPRLHMHTPEVSRVVGMRESPGSREPRLPDTGSFRSSVNTYNPSHPVERFELGDSIPYSVRRKTVLPSLENRLGNVCRPSSELELSRIDSSIDIDKGRCFSVDFHPVGSQSTEVTKSDPIPNELPQTLKTPEFVNIPNIIHMASDGKFSPHLVQPATIFPITNWERTKRLESLNNVGQSPHKTETDYENELPMCFVPQKYQWKPVASYTKRHCSCHKCIPYCDKETIPSHFHSKKTPIKHARPTLAYVPQVPNDLLEPSLCSPCVQPKTYQNPNSKTTTSCPYPNQEKTSYEKPICCHTAPSTHLSAEAKTIDKCDQRLQDSENCTDVVKQTAVTNEKREPTVSDLFKIIKLQNEQLKLLQEQVDRLIVNSQNNKPEKTSSPFRPVQNFIQERIAVETVEDSHHNYSVGVMTSFEVVRTSTVMKKTAQIQCNRSQVSMKEVISATKECNTNFLDGIQHVNQNFGCEEIVGGETDGRGSSAEKGGQYERSARLGSDENRNNERTVNDQSLCNFQIDNAVTPQLSPDQSIYLDVKDYSDSDNEDESPVGWTYYNKVMSHVNDMLQESCLPSSAGALHRRAVAAADSGGPGAAGGARCTRLHVDRTDVSVTTSKRVTFGQHPASNEPPRAFSQPVASSDTSLHINRLAAKYLKTVEPPLRPTRAADAPLEMSLATQRYMEQHNLLGSARTPLPSMPTKFLDITALKQQPKLL